MAMAKELRPTEQMLDADGLRVQYFEAGKGDPIIVFAAGDYAVANPILRKLGESHRIVSFELSGLPHISANQLARKLASSLTRLGVDLCSVIGAASGAPFALALTIAAPERIGRLILLSPVQLSNDAEPLDLAAVKAPTLVLVDTRDASAASQTGRLCREKINTCHLSFVYGTGDALGGRLEARLDPIVQFLQEGEQFIIFRESQIIRP
jgi:pimeloyl-ACP methyl ester carboxylesterase